jgi:protein quaking
LPDPVGPVVTLSEKVFVPNKEYPDFNFVGRILGPRGMTAKQLEQETGCKIMVRGKGSMRDKKKEEMNRGKPNWEHLNEELHVLITVEDSRNRAEVKMARAMDEVKKLLVPAPEGEDELKKMQLMELAIINGTYRDSKQVASIAQSARILGPPLAMPPQLRSPTPAGAPIILAPRMASLAQMSPTVTSAGLLNNGPPPLVSPADTGLVYGHYDPYAAAMAHATLLEYPGLDQTGAGAVPKLRRTVGMREHPYTRVSLP